MRTRYVICALAVVGSTACAAAATATSAAGSGGAGRTVREAASSANWSGYVAGGDTASTQFSAVSGSWTEPSAKCSAGQGYSSFWVGLGGAGRQSGALEQVGTEADCGSGGSASDFAWYELVPSAPVRLDLTISPGDHVTGKVTVNGTDVTVSLSDDTTGASATKTLQMSNPDVSSAEWIAEAPSSCDGSDNCQTLPLADFGKVSFTRASATAGGHTGSISDPNWSSQAVQLDGGTADGGSGFISSQSPAGASPSGLSSDGSSFSVSSVPAGTSAASTGTGGDPYGSGGGSPYGSGGGSPYGYGGGDPYGYGYGGGNGGYGGYGGYGYGYGGGYGGYGYAYGGGAGYGYGGY